MTVAMTQGVINAFNPDARRRWERRRARHVDAQRPRGQSKAEFATALAQLASAFPGNVKVN